jgi:hypothetical protein
LTSAVFVEAYYTSYAVSLNEKVCYLWVLLAGVVSQ